MVTPIENERQLENSRTKILAKSFYRHLRTEGLSHDQIIELSATLLDLVHSDLTPTAAPERMHRS
jgi:hypothetical protein